MAYEMRSMANDVWFMACAYSLWFVASGLRFVFHGLWLMVNGLWLVVCSL